MGKTHALIYSNTENSPRCAPLLIYSNDRKTGAGKAASFVLPSGDTARRREETTKAALASISRWAPRAGAGRDVVRASLWRRNGA